MHWWNTRRKRSKCIIYIQTNDQNESIRLFLNKKKLIVFALFCARFFVMMMISNVWYTPEHRKGPIWRRNCCKFSIFYAIIMIKIVIRRNHIAKRICQTNLHRTHTPKSIPLKWRIVSVKARLYSQLIPHFMQLKLLCQVVRNIPGVSFSHHFTFVMLYT